MFTKSPTAPANGRTYTDDPEYVAEAEKLQHLRDDLKATEDRRTEIAMTFPRDEWGIRRPVNSPTREIFAARAENLLAGGSGSPRDLPDMVSEYDMLFDRTQLLKAAIGIQKERVSEVQRRVAQEISAEAIPEYKKIAQRVLDAAIALKRVSDEERSFMDDLMDRGGSIASVSVANTLTDNKVGSLLREAQDYYGIRPKGR